jgi:mRNA-degrading endonuclease RelE of RelBE toxin-antitoxin system
LGGLRKVRWSGKGRGKRGGARVIYLLLVQPGVVYLLQAYTKGDIADLSPEQKKRLRRAVEDIKKHHTK